MKTRKLLSLLLAVALIFSTLSMPVLAATDQPKFSEMSTGAFNKAAESAAPLPSIFQFDKDLPRYNWGPGAPAPAKLKGVTYTLADNVIKVKPEVTKSIQSVKQVENTRTSAPGSISRVIGQGGLMKADKLQAAASLSTIKPGSVFVDLENDLAFKVPTLPAEKGDQFEGYVSVIQPEIQDVIKDFKIPKQQVQLNKSNVTHFVNDTKGNSLDKYLKKPGQTYVMSQDTTMEPIKPTHLKNIIAEFYFPKEGVTLNGSTPSGGQVAINVKGYLGIGDMTLDGYYDKWDYAFYFSVAEELQLQATLAADLKEEVRIPILGVDIGSDSEVGSIAGGLFIVVGIDGKFSLQVESRQWMKLEKVGLKGSNFFYVPCSIKPLLVPGESGFMLDSQFNGAVDGYIKGGALLELSLLGLDIVGAGVFAGMGADTTISGDYLEADLYGLIQAYVKFLGKHKNIINWKPTILHKKQFNTAGYIVTFKEACAYRDEVWGTLRFDAGTKGTVPEPDKDITLVVKNTLGKETEYSNKTDENGNFHLSGVDLRKDDEVFLRLQERGKTNFVRSEPINPTFPYKNIILQEADFFNDYVKGYVPSVIVKDWDTGGQKEMIFEADKSKDSSIKVKLNNKETPVTLDKQGFFELTGINVLPQDTAACQLKFDGWTVDSNQAKPSVDFQADAIRIPFANEKTVEIGKPVDMTKVLETVVVTNMRGTKQYTGNGNFTVSGYTQASTGCYLINPDTGLPILQAEGIPSQTQAVKLSAAKTDKEDLGVSCFTNTIIKKWFWEPKPGANALSLTKPLVVTPPRTPSTPINPMSIPLKPKELDTNNLLSNIPQHSFILSYDDRLDSYDKYKFDILSKDIDGSYTIRWDDKIVISYEGAEIVLEFKDDRRDSSGDSKFETLSSDWLGKNVEIMLNNYMEKMNGSLVFPMPDQIDMKDSMTNKKQAH